MVVPGSYRYGGSTVNPTIEDSSFPLNLGGNKSRQLLEDGTTRINIPLMTKPRQGLEQIIAEMRPRPPPAAITRDH